MVYNVFAFGAVQIHQMQILNPVGFKLLRYFKRIFIINPFGAVIAFGKAYTLAIYYIYCWYYSHIIVLRSFLKFVRQQYCFFPGEIARRKNYLFLMPK